MSIIIKGMDMPKTYLRNVIIAPDGKIVYEDEEGITYGLRKGTARQLPPHGRLIDADKAKKDEGIFWDLDTTHRMYEDTVGDIFDRQPTIIEAEGERE